MKNWKAWVALVLLIALVLFIVFDWGRFLSDFWPIDKSSVGPNLLASVVQAALVLGVVALIYPPIRHWIEEHLEHLHTKIDHVILHSSEIPNEVPGVPEHRQPEKSLPDPPQGT